jgi:hypothetical protein
MAAKPDFRLGVVDDAKLLDYLLARSHPVGREKARYFRSIGFRPQTARALRRALLRHASQNPVAARLETAFGAKYVVEGPLEAPNGTYVMRSIWFVAHDAEAPKFVTAYPLRGAAR